MSQRSCTIPPVFNEHEKEQFGLRLSSWYLANRRAMQWHGTDAYSVWVSEIMLQQTQAATVTDYYNRFMKAFPTVHQLAKAPIETVLSHWSGLGYYARARNLHRAAQVVVTEFGGVVPDKLEALLSLPGVGRYTAGAILSIAFNRQVPLVDANVERVISRLFVLDEPPSSSPGKANLWAIAAQLVPAASPGIFNQGLMELGATVCTPSDPACHRCPVEPFCKAARTPNPAQWPPRLQGKKIVQETHCSVIVRNNSGGVYLLKRPQKGLWGGLWEFPRVICTPEESPTMAAQRAANEILRVKVGTPSVMAVIRHTVTHHNITLYGCEAEPLEEPVTGERIKLVPIDSLNDFPFAAPQVLLCSALTNRRDVEVQQALNL